VSEHSAQAAPPPSREMPAQHKRDLALLRGVLSAVDSSLESGQALGLALQTILEILPGFAGMVMVSDERTPGFEIVAHRGLPTEGLPQRIFLDRVPCREAVETGLPLLFVECPSDDCLAGGLVDRPHGCLLAPLKTHQAVLGLLCLFYPTEFEVGDLDLSLWEDIGLQLGRRISADWLQAREAQERQLLRTLYTVSNHLASSLDSDWLLSNALNVAISATEARKGNIFLLPEQGSTTARLLRRDLSTEEVDEVMDQVLAEGLAGWVVDHRQGAIIADTAQDPRWLALPDDPAPARSALAVPLMAQEQVLGVLTLDHVDTNHFDHRHMALMRAIAHQISTAVERARLYNEMSHVAEDLAVRVEERTRELQEIEDLLIQADKLAALGELTAGIAHEINNPLHILQAYLEYLTTRPAPGEEILELEKPMGDALDNVARLARQLTDFSRPAAGEWQPLDVNRAVTNVLRLVHKEMVHRQISVHPSLTDGLPLVRGDKRQLEQVFLNLVLNARDAMPSGGQLTVETRAEGDAVYVTIRDTGIGINEEALPHIFEPYFTTKEDRGTGLGLAICQRVMMHHGGKITVRSKLGEGATFTVHLPVDVYGPAEAADAGCRAPGRSLAPEDVTPL
jgi:signal transduction histidine kinase